MILEHFAEILSVLRRNKLRTLLTALSVTWGTFMLALLLGAGRGLENGATWEFRDNATAAIWVRAGQTSLPFAGRRPGRDVRFMNDDLVVLKRQIPGIGETSGRFYLWGEYSVSYGSKRASFDVRGVHPAHRFLEKTQMVRGRFLNDADVREARKVVVIGEAVRKTLFGEENPLGKRLRLRGLFYQVVGEFQDGGGEAELRKIYVPISTAQAVYHEPGRLHHLMFTLQSEDLEKSRSIGRATRELLGKRHGVSPADRRAIRVDNNLEEFTKVTQVFSWIGVFVWIVGVGTLLAGIVGIGNIMLISVAERTKEIGIRKALGATPFSIVSMIVVEAVLITALSGYVGLVAGVGVVELAARTVHDAPFLKNPSVDLRVALSACAFLVLAGTLAGLFPALRAARVDPIVALREGD